MVFDMVFNAATLRTWLSLAADRLQAAKDELTALDAAIGDADHGLNIARGFAAASAKISARIDAPATAPATAGELGAGGLGALFKETGMTLMSSVGGASGMLYGNFFLRAAASAGSKTQLDGAELLAALQSGRDGIVQRGRAAAGDKTMVDAWNPAIAALAEGLQSGQDLPGALAAAVTAAEGGRDGTAPLQAKKGRASYLGVRSVGHLDPGAASTAILLRALLDAVTAQP